MFFVVETFGYVTLFNSFIYFCSIWMHLFVFLNLFLNVSCCIKMKSYFYVFLFFFFLVLVHNCSYRVYFFFFLCGLLSWSAGIDITSFWSWSGEAWSWVRSWSYEFQGASLSCRYKGLTWKKLQVTCDIMCWSKGEGEGGVQRKPGRVEGFLKYCGKSLLLLFYYFYFVMIILWGRLWWGGVRVVWWSCIYGKLKGERVKMDSCVR